MIYFIFSCSQDSPCYCIHFLLWTKWSIVITWVWYCQTNLSFYGNRYFCAVISGHTQWRTVSFWRPGQEVKLGTLLPDPPCPPPKKKSRPRTNLGHFQKWKGKKKFLLYIYKALYAFPELILNFSIICGHTDLAYHQAASLPVVCHFRQSGEVINLVAWHCLALGLPSAATGACAVVQILPSKGQCREWQASLKAT